MALTSEKEHLSPRDKLFVTLSSLIVLGIGLAGAFSFFENNPGLAKLLLQN